MDALVESWASFWAAWPRFVEPVPSWASLFLFAVTCRLLGDLRGMSLGVAWYMSGLATLWGVFWTTLMLFIMTLVALFLFGVAQADDEKKRR